MKSKIYNGIAISAGSALLCQFASSYLLSFTSLRSYFLDPDYVSTAFADVLVTILLYTAAVLFWHLSSQHLGNVRRFWRLMSMGCAIWGITWAIWIWLEVINRIEVPTPSIADIVLFIHLVPFMGALLEQPHHQRELPKSNSLLDFLLLASWWIFLYVFTVGPWQFIGLDKAQYQWHFDQLYILENLVLLIGVFAIWARCKNHWKYIYAYLFFIYLIYSMASFVVNYYINNNTFQSGQMIQVLYDIPVVGLIWLALYMLKKPVESDTVPESTSTENPWMARVTIVVLIALPLMAYLTSRGSFPYAVEHFKLNVLRTTQVLLSIIVFYRLSLLNRDLARLLGESREAYENQQRLQEQLVQSEKMAALGRLAAGAAHEINNPLTVIFGYSEMLSKDEGLTPVYRDMADKIHTQARRTRDVISQLMTFAKPSHGPHTPVDLNTVVSNALKMRRLDLEKEQVIVQSELAIDLPMIKGHENQLLQISFHLISNAIEVMRGQASAKILLIRSFLEEDHVALDISDSGPGTTHPERIFDPFYTTKEIGQGTGLGLSAVYGIVREHNGSITCKNRTDNGLVFQIRFPINSEPSGKTITDS